ncbi:hypothetical protein ACFQXB_11270 [Plastorhodobacter daqingensis]|uniref:Sugar transporter n=1 Tax=Plastorhodobacter daqingensis TaxID=1387281 RepID=A0ABW2UMR2_9RHOB
MAETSGTREVAGTVSAAAAPSGAAGGGPTAMPGQAPQAAVTPVRPGPQPAPTQPAPTQPAQAQAVHPASAPPRAPGAQPPAARAVPPAAAQTPAQRAAPPVAGPAPLRRRHRGILLSFVLLVLLPVIATAAYLWLMAEDQYASTVSFSVRKEETSSSLDLLGGITRLTGSASSDSDILYDFIRSQDLVATIDADLDLRARFSRAWPGDPVFAFNPEGTIEDLHRHWERRVKIIYDTSSGIITLRVTAFTPQDAQEIATAIYGESSRMINALAQDARADATRYAQDELDRALERLKDARERMTGFRLQTQIVDPQADLQGQMGVINTLQSQLAEAMVELDLLRETTREGDPRLTQIARRIEVIENRIIAERRKFGEGGQGPGGADYARLVGEFERLMVDLDFAEQSYRAAMAAYDGAVSEAQRQSRYLAAHVRPTLAQRAMFPERELLLALAGFFLLMAWAVGVLVYYSVRDRR